MASTRSSADAHEADVGLVFATPIEINPFLERCERIRKYIGDTFTFRGALLGDIRVALVQCGLGPKAARQATHALLDGHRPKWVISTGFSGALADHLKVGDIVVGNSLVDEQREELKIDVGMSSDPAIGRYVGRLLMVDRVIRKVAEKKSLHESTQALAVDMESLAVARACRERHVRCMVVRAISDDLSADLPPEILTLVGDTGSVRLGAALAAVWKRPGSVKDMWRLRETAGIAAERLATFLDGVVEQLHKATK